MGLATGSPHLLHGRAHFHCCPQPGLPLRERDREREKLQPVKWLIHFLITACHSLPHTLKLTHLLCTHSHPKLSSSSGYLLFSSLTSPDVMRYFSALTVHFVIATTYQTHPIPLKSGLVLLKLSVHHVSSDRNVLEKLKINQCT